jgi:hypothetical protein
MVGGPAELTGILAFGRWERSWNPETGIGNERPRVSLGEVVGWEGQVHEQEPEVEARPQRLEVGLRPEA